ncbi:MAG TPA: cobyric acid synthase [Methanoregulaceae archaeon]|nr:cobyric acid synthase [Methanoregulaceae archaeon]HQJ87334.1 cobyric acid synthase [Methanoregulaceae archaeon]
MSLMILGTASHVGKSTIVAAVCRLLSDRGYAVSPFKSQNMSLNSWVTRDGSEIGIAQAMQAFAARTEPRAEMNPVLLKPKGDRTSQIVLMGRPYRDVAIADYYRETDCLLERALDAYDRLAEDHDCVVVEGAGGAAEVNLYDRDIANIRLAERLRLPIVLVADIERGGVFAQICGTIALLPPAVRSLVRGVIVNKFRGDPALFEDGVALIEALSGVPVLGVLPYVSLDLPSEDSLSIGDKRVRNHPIRIAVVRFNRISNFTDFEVLERQVAVDYPPPGAPLTGYDCIILPGTKNTMEDLALLHASGGADEVRRARHAGIPVIGICGGYQMLGRRVEDRGVEAGHSTLPGLGLLGVETCFARYEKTTRQTTVEANPAGPILSRIGRVIGYEIHMGETTRDEGLSPAFGDDGAVSGDGLVIGTYLHGLFQNPSAVDGLLAYLHERRGLPYEPMVEDDPYDELARLLVGHADVSRLLALALGEHQDQAASG